MRHFNPIILLVLCAYTSASLNAQEIEFDDDLKYYQGLNKEAAEQGFKTVTLISTIDKKKKKQLLYKAEYNEHGKITALIDHNFDKLKDFERIEFSYDSLLRIDAYTVRYSSRKKRHKIFKFNYDLNDRVRMMETQFYHKNEYAYSRKYYKGEISGTNVTWTSSNKDTIYTFRNKNDSIIGKSNRISDQFTDNRLYNDLGCLLGIQSSFETRRTEIRDSNCRLLGYLDEKLHTGIWVPIRKQLLIYAEDVIVGRHEYESNYYKKEPEEVELSLIWKMYFEYDHIGLIQRLIETDHKGNTFINACYHYEYYE